MLWFSVAAVAVIAGLMIVQARRMDREFELGALLETCNDVHRARAEGWVRQDLERIKRAPFDGYNFGMHGLRQLPQMSSPRVA